MNGKLNVLSLGLMALIVVTAISSFLFFKAYQQDKEIISEIAGLKVQAVGVEIKALTMLETNEPKLIENIKDELGFYSKQLAQLTKEGSAYNEVLILKQYFNDFEDQVNLINESFSGQGSKSDQQKELLEISHQFENNVYLLKTELVKSSKIILPYTQDLTRVNAQLVYLATNKSLTLNEVQNISDQLSSAFSILEQGFRKGKLPKNNKVISLVKAISSQKEVIDNIIQDIQFNEETFIRHKVEIEQLLKKMERWNKQHDSILLFMKKVDDHRVLNPLSVTILFLFTLIWMVVALTYGYSLPLTEINSAKNESGRYKKISNQISSEIEGVLKGLGQLRNGDLSIRLDSSAKNTGEIAQGINDYISVLETVIVKVKQLVTEISSAVEQSAATTRDMAKQRMENAERVDNTYNLTKGIEAHVRSLSDEMRSSVLVAKESRHLVKKGQESAQDIVTLIDGAVKNQRFIENKNDALVDKSSGLMSVIDKIMAINKEQQNVAINITLLSSSLDGEALERMSTIAEMVSINTTEVKSYVDQVIKFAEDVHAYGGETKNAISSSIQHLENITEKAKGSADLFQEIDQSSSSVLESSKKCIDSAVGINKSSSNIVEQIDKIRNGVNNNSQEIRSVSAAIENIMRKTKELSISFSRFVTQ